MKLFHTYRIYVFKYRFLIKNDIKYEIIVPKSLFDFILFKKGIKYEINILQLFDIIL